ncbi:fungal specific transcription factor domain-containing protein [Aspergillus novofumigatus IBT 16806]|uniref:Xylanolytic transcriptional activator regulatory domain-containing protein n=1 Tax=Aspergillus novofumigatus (strain IBT 16806) TaxID=1392255 RepID=A0A2I1BSV5_ASPN1|nr:uncharacterized protein P174DRAFT_473645 [Aspergillus novofumigatus IBT 16806]PKX88442.1 hypothetical protein P174DRAFT_473645 [Aspergillus novofumigatus IBT 16806]
MTALSERSVSVDAILCVYFRNIHRWLPVIAEQKFRAQISHIHSGLSAELALLLLAMYLLMENEWDESSNQTGGQQHLDQHCSYLVSFLLLARGPSLELVQAGLLLILYELGSGFLEAAFLRVATCARLAYILGLQVDESFVDDCSGAWCHAEERRRVWTGLYMMDRLVYQAMPGIMAPHAVEEPDDGFPLPIGDQESEQKPNKAFPSFTTSLNVPLSYYTREIQAVRILGNVQMLQNLARLDSFQQHFHLIDSNLMQLMQRLFEQSVGWEAYLGATAIALMAVLTLHRSQVGYGAPSVIAQLPDILHRAPLSMAALSSVITMVRDICLQLNALKTREEIARVPLPAVMCIGETALTALWLKQADPDESHVDSLPFKLALGRVKHYWILADYYIKKLVRNEAAHLDCGMQDSVQNQIPW